MVKPKEGPGRHRPARAVAGALAAGAVLAVLLTPACRREAETAKPPRDDQPAKKFHMPKDVPGLKEAGVDEVKPGAAEVMVKAKYDREELETYTYKYSYPAGTIKGSCRFLKLDPKVFEDPQPIQFTGENAIRDPEPKELAYYKNIELNHNPWWVLHGRKKYHNYQPVNAVIMLRDIKIGRHPKLTRPVMMIRQGRIGPGDGANNGGNNVQFCPLHERAQFTTWDEYPSRVLLAQEPTGKKVFDQIVRYAHGKKDTHTKTGHLKYMPELITTAPLREKGIYTVTDRRHPWIKGYLFVVDNPYVTVTTCRRPGKLSIFNIGGVPPGTHTVEVWHPFFEPVQRTFQVKVEASRITEVLIEFHPPAPPGGRTRPATPKAPPTKKPA